MIWLKIPSPLTRLKMAQLSVKNVLFLSPETWLENVQRSPSKQPVLSPYTKLEMARLPVINIPDLVSTNAAGKVQRTP